MTKDNNFSSLETIKDIVEVLVVKDNYNTNIIELLSDYVIGKIDKNEFEQKWKEKQKESKQKVAKLISKY